MIVSLYCDNKFDNLSRINARSKNLEKINVPPYDIKSIKMKNLYRGEFVLLLDLWWLSLMLIEYQDLMNSKYLIVFPPP